MINTSVTSDTLAALMRGVFGNVEVTTCDNALSFDRPEPLITFAEDGAARAGDAAELRERGYRFRQVVEHMPGGTEVELVVREWQSLGIADDGVTPLMALAAAAIAGEASTPTRRLASIVQAREEPGVTASDVGEVLGAGEAERFQNSGGRVVGLLGVPVEPSGVVIG